MHKNTDYNEYSYDLIILIFMVVFSQPDVSGLCVRAGFGAQNCQPALNLNRSKKLQVCTSPRLTQNPCSSDTFGEQKK